VRQPDITWARRDLDWEPTVDLRSGLERTIPYFKNLVENQAAVARTL
jgi:UDP-glucuronate decarboxylase